MKKQFFSLALFAAAWLAGGTAWAQSTPSQDDDGYYLLGSVDDVEWFANEVNINHNVDIKGKLTSDIDYEDVENAHTPIGNDAALGFKFNGIFDGQYHRIKRMKINYVADNSNNTENVAFFGAVRGTATIKNLIIDKSCSITTSGTTCRAAGLIACLQTYGGEGSVCSILNCVNEADVTNHNGVAGGIIGAGTSQYAYFEMHNCVNTGKITSDNNKTTAFNGWNKGNEGGSPKKSSQVRNCYNLGELTAIDNNQQFFRGNYRDMNNSYDARYYGMQGTYISPSAVNSGELCYKLNEGETEGRAYTQDLSDPNSIPMPIPGPTVYRNTDYYCGATPTAKGSYTYSNTELTVDDVPASHSFSNETGLCTFCSYPKEDWKSVSNDGYYHLSNATDVEWFSHMVRDAGHGAMNAKLDADIDFGGVPNAHLPIGSSGKKYFGHFDGQNHRIIGMVLNTASKLKNRDYDGNGFFGSVRGGGTDANETVTNEVIIENIIIDASCSIEHDNNFAAGVVAHINSRNDDNSNIIIRNCGNEANVTTSGKNAAGILGCVEGTDVGLKLYNLWNKGNIVGLSGESAAICAWTGKRNVDGQVDVKGCWNIGEVTGIDVYHYNMIRRNTNIVPRNIVDLCIANGTNGGNQGTVAVHNTADPIASGELCYLLNGDQSEIVYTQNLGTDEMPVYGTASSQVYQVGTIDCTGAAVGDINYSNTEGESVQRPHDYSEYGICSVCNGFEEPDLVSDWYELRNAGNVEWLSAKVATSGGAAFYAKMMNDIDFTGVTHTPIGYNNGNKFCGEFNGQGKRILNMKSYSQDTKVGVFGALRGGTLVKNLIVDASCQITGVNHLGGIAGSCQTKNNSNVTVENCINEASIHGTGYGVGGIIGQNESSDLPVNIINCGNSGSIQADDANACAVIGWAGGANAEIAINNFWNTGTITKGSNDHLERDGHAEGDALAFNLFNATQAAMDANIHLTNCYDASASAQRSQGTILEASAASSGELTYKLGGVWRQTLGTDAHPVFEKTHGIVNYISAAGYTTQYIPTTDVEIPSGVEAYAGVISGSAISLKAIETAISKEDAVVLKGSEGYYSFVPTTGVSKAAMNDLEGSDGTVTGAAGNIYALSQKSGAVGFYPVAASVTIPAGKAYLEYTASDPSSPVKGFTFVFDDDDATGISLMEDGRSQMEGGAIYNIAGQRLDNSQFTIHNSQLKRGIYIVNGKKVLK